MPTLKLGDEVPPSALTAMRLLATHSRNCYARLVKRSPKRNLSIYFFCPDDAMNRVGHQISPLIAAWLLAYGMVTEDKDECLYLSRAGREYLRQLTASRKGRAAK